MTGPHDPDHDNPECAETILPVWRRDYFDGVYAYSFSLLPDASVFRLVVPFGWSPVIDPERGIVLESLRADRPRFGPREAYLAACRGDQEFRMADDEHEKGRA